VVPVVDPYPYPGDGRHTGDPTPFSTFRRQASHDTYGPIFSSHGGLTVASEFV